ncbi:toll-like receptor 8 [Mytilus californianus]|uniref:toll-like receptor 8 n=1 Tax=Mytilus californianus TaxID=6549 RepID=UPI0022479EA6|nr:toll-like receptor 8 [Mytilus californianus]
MAVVFSEEQNKSQYYSLYHSQGYLSQIPINICDFPNIVRIDLQSNQLTEVGNLSCLSMLDTLDLSYNKIHFIGNYTFLSLTNLRELRVTHNGLKVLAPATITASSLQIFRADFSHNEMKSIEFSNMISESDFCEITFASNDISKIVNTNNFKIDPEKDYRGGIVELVGNSFTTFIDFEKLGITDIAILGKVISYGFVMPDVKWTCDCRMEPYLELAEDVIKRIWRDYFNISCWNPPEYRGKTIPDIVKEGRLDIFICNLTEKCPRNCTCFYQPKERRTVVDCSDAGLKKMPCEVPQWNRFSNNLTLIFKNNNITHFDNKSYLKDATVLDMSGNKVATFSPEAIEMLPEDIVLNFADNNFKKVPRAFQTLNPCKSKFGDVAIDCNCDTEWIKHWADNRGLKQCSNMSSYVCETDHGLIPVDEISTDDICKQEKFMITSIISIILSLLSTLIVIIFGVVYLFRYEVYLLQRKYFLRNSASKVGCFLKYDAFVSFNDENDELRMWVLNVLVRHLEASGYRLFVPCRDLPPGSVKEEEILEQIINSRKYLIILSDYYLHQDTPWTQIEWKYIWCHFRQYVERNIIVINFDHLGTSEQADPKLRAFVRLGYDIDFSNRKHDLIFTVKLRLGTPLKSLFFHGNKKTKFMGHNLINNKGLFDPFTVVESSKIKLEV